MARLELVPFAEDHLDRAAALLAARHASHRRAEPLLSARFEEAAAAREELERAWQRESGSGAVALRDGKVVGYLIGAPREANVWGENVWIEAAGQAVEEAEDIRDLYAFAAARWFEEGRRRHYALAPASDEELVDAWFRLGFGHQQAHGIREIPAHVEVNLPQGFEIREPEEQDIDELIALDLALPTHQRSSPVFSEQPLPTGTELRSEWHSTMAGNDETVIVGWHEGRPVALWAITPAKVSHHHQGLMQPENASYLAFASTLPDLRGSGIGVALTDASLAAAAADGYTTMVTDWRVTNLLASRFWPRRGFRPAFSRLARTIP